MENKDLKSIKCRIKIARQLFPKGNKKRSSGEFAILSAYVIDVIEGEPKLDTKWKTITLTGNMCEIEANEVYTVVANEVENEKFGTQYQVVFIGRVYDLTDATKQRAFLSKIITEKQVESLFLAYNNPVEILENGDVEALCQIKGIKQDTANRLIQKYNDAKDYSSAYVSLDKFGLTPNMIKKLVDSYGSPDIVIEKINENPYLIADEVDGIGWSKADEIALKNGCGEFSVYRLKAYIDYYLRENAQEGNSYVHIDDMVNALEDVIGFNIPEDVFNQAFKEMVLKKMWHSEDKEFVGLKRYYNLEKNIAKELKRILKSQTEINVVNWEKKVKLQEDRQGWEYTDEQKIAIKMLINNNIVLLSGGAGTGKSSTVSGMLAALKGYSFAQTALSGKASVNLTNITNEEGFTIHRLLEYNPRLGFVRNELNKLEQDIIILDELSMVGGELFLSLLKGIKDGAKLIMLGDTGQLESIGVANIMQDIIDSGVIPHAELTKIHRQASKSAIITESMKVRNSEHIIDGSYTGSETRGELQDLQLDIYKDKTLTCGKVMEYVKKSLDEINNILEMQVITPMKKRGDSCTYRLNLKIQKLLKKRGDIDKDTFVEILPNSEHPYDIYVGDKVINIKNNYKTRSVNGLETPVFNGNIGIVKQITKDEMIIDFEHIGEVIIPEKSFTSIELAYAITAHKSQGSGYRYVICALDYSSYSLLSKQMLYTMLTRSKKHCVLCAEVKAVRYAIKHDSITNKQTFLKDMLQANYLI